MKKLLILGLMLIALPALATTICADDDVIAIVLDPQIVGKKYISDKNLFEWSVTFNYGTVWGLATCMDTLGTKNVAAEELRSAEDNELAMGGERKGQYCWCQMTHPALSRWVFQKTYSSVDECREGCTAQCAYGVSYDGLRTNMFGSVAH